MMPASRRNLIRRALSSLALLAAAAVGSTSVAQTTKIRVSTLPIIDSAPMQVAIAKGFFAEEGLEIDTTPTTTGAAGLPAVAAGQIQIAFSNIISITLGAKQGLPFQIIAAGSSTGTTPPDLAGLVVKKGSTIRTGKDLEGKRLAVNARNNVTWLYARAWVQATGGKPEAVTFLEVPFPQMIDAVKGDRVDAAFVVEPFLSAGVGSGDVSHIAWPYNAIQKEIPIAQYAATKSFIAQNPDLIERWVRAYNKGVDWTNRNNGSDELIKIITGYTRLSPNQVKSLKIPPFLKTVDPAALDSVVRLMGQHGLMEGSFDPRSMLHRTATQPPR